MNSNGVSFTEFSYQLLQAYDFLHLFQKHNCTIQLGGSDQWGNITAGIDLIRKTKLQTDGSELDIAADDYKSDDEQDKAFGITIPLITTQSGEKFGKSEGNAIWLDETLLSVFDFYQV